MICVSDLKMQVHAFQSAYHVVFYYMRLHKILSRSASSTMNIIFNYFKTRLNYEKIRCEMNTAKLEKHKI